MVAINMPSVVMNSAVHLWRSLAGGAGAHATLRHARQVVRPAGPCRLLWRQPPPGAVGAPAAFRNRPFRFC